MPQDKRKFLRPKPTKWKHLPTVLRRYPELFIEGMDAIAQWADKQDDPEEAIAQILEFIKEKGG